MKESKESKTGEAEMKDEKRERIRVAMRSRTLLKKSSDTILQFTPFLITHEGIYFA